MFWTVQHSLCGLGQGLDDGRLSVVEDRAGLERVVDELDVPPLGDWLSVDEQASAPLACRPSPLHLLFSARSLLPGDCFVDGVESYHAQPLELLHASLFSTSSPLDIRIRAKIHLVSQALFIYSLLRFLLTFLGCFRCVFPSP